MLFAYKSYVLRVYNDIKWQTVACYYYDYCRVRESESLELNGMEKCSPVRGKAVYFPFVR